MNTKATHKYPLSELGATIAVREAKAQFSALVERAAAGAMAVIAAALSEAASAGLLPRRAQAQGILPHSWPSHSLSNAHIRLKAYAPVPETGYYQAVRFDWSSLLGDIEVDGLLILVDHHPKKHNPHGHDHVAGRRRSCARSLSWTCR